MKTARYVMQREHAPPGFWPWTQEEMALDGVEFASTVPTRFFQTIDRYPREWGSLVWRIQLNQLVAGQAGLPLFRSFYPGVEWNLSGPNHRWFLTAWFRWQRGAGDYDGPHCAWLPCIDGETVLFSIPLRDQKFQSPVYLRSRVDTRDRNRIAKSVQSQGEDEAKNDPATIVLDDLIDLNEPK